MQHETGTLRIFPDRKNQIIRDFGSSICWWGSGMGTTPLAEHFLTLLYTDAGLGLNVLRFNAGGGLYADRSDACTDASSWRAPLSPLMPDGTYDLTRDPGTLNLLRKALELGTVTDFTLFMNSPPSCMTISGKTCAHRPEREGEFISNLRPDCYEAYARYVADVTQLYIHAGIPVKYVSPINEPQWQWDDRNHQEGCHYTPEECIRIFRLVIRALQARAGEDPAMSSVRLSMPETAQWYQRTYVHDMYQLMCQDPEIAPYVDHFSAHSYGTNAQQKIDTKAFFDSLGRRIPLHQTEWGPLHTDFTDSMDFALEMSQVIWEDMTLLHTVHWTWWTGVAGPSYPSGLIDYDRKNGTYVLTKRFYAMKHHSRFIRDHIQIDVEKSGLPDTVSASAYLSQDGKELVMILLNHSREAQQILLEGICSDSCPAVYETSDQLDCAYLGDRDISQGITLTGRSITNLVLTRK